VSRGQGSRARVAQALLATAHAYRGVALFVTTWFVLEMS
jgi:hypothetical protein